MHRCGSRGGYIRNFTWAIECAILSAALSASHNAEAMTEVEVSSPGKLSSSWVRGGVWPTKGDSLSEVEVIHSARASVRNHAMSATPSSRLGAGTIFFVSFGVTVIVGLIFFAAIVAARPKRHSGRPSPPLMGFEGHGMPEHHEETDQSEAPPPNMIMRAPPPKPAQAAPPAKAPAPPVQKAAPPVQTAAPPVQMAAPPVKAQAAEPPAAQAAPTAGAAFPGGKAKGKGKGKAEPRSINPDEPEEPEEKEEHQEAHKCGARAPQKNMRMDLIFEVKNGKNMPSVNTFGGVDPFIEIRCIKGDPKTKKGGLTAKASAKAKTQSRDGDSNPAWNETLTLSKIAYSDEDFITIILWDANITANTAIGYHSVCTTELLNGMTYDPSKGIVEFKEYNITSFTNLLEDKSMALTASVNMSFAYLEVHKFKLHVEKCSHLPKIDALGSIDPFVEIRIVNGDPWTMQYHNKKGSETVWSGKTDTVHENMDPKFNADIQFTIAGNPTYHMIVCVTDSGTLGNTPVGMTTVPLKQILANVQGEKETWKAKLQKIPNWAAPENLKLAKVSFSVTHEQVLGNDS